ncbi:MAG: NADP-dependent glyceraldehyde-3-phosphate dehydrogenase [Spirochaetes bacterium]|nr:NADP-dependent glyceraldehyde-3-phosphate dehydrogenase [Spirochaetota bacterium]
MASTDKISSIFPERGGIPAEYLPSFPIIQKEYLVNGEIRAWNGEMQEVLSPICLNTGAGLEQQVIGRYPLFTGKEALEALDAAVAAYDSGRGRWPTLPVEERIRCLEKFTFMMKEERNEIVNLLMWEIGKTHADSAKEFDRTIEYISFTIDALKELDRAGSRFEIKDGIIGQIRRAPLGVVLCMGPFNYPLNETFTTLIPALLMGNTVIFKPPKIGVLLHRPLLRAFRDAFPAGVVNTIYGDGAKVVGPLMESGKIDVLAFIGSSRVADIIKKQHPKPHRLRSVLGLEAKNAGIVLRDADIDPTVKECVTGALSFNGQRCTALKIIFVHKDIVVEFLKKLNQRIASLAPGMPWDEGVGLTPLPEPDKTEHMKRYIEDAKEQGAMVVNEKGGAINRTFMFPAVLYPVNNRMKIYHEEQFGPVIPVVPYDRIEEPLDYVVNSNYGQQVAVFGNDPDAIARLIDPLVNQVCRVNINSQCQRGPDTFPFTGRKDSAEGTLSVTDALRVFTIRTLVAAKETDQNKRIITEIIREKKSNFLSTDFIF